MSSSWDTLYGLTHAVGLCCLWHDWHLLSCDGLTYNSVSDTTHQMSLQAGVQCDTSHAGFEA